MKLPTIARCEKVLGLPAEKWKGKCYAIACGLVAKKLVPGVAVYGHWLGPVARGSFFAHKRNAPFIQHGWVLLPDGGIVDPTRWVFTNEKPYIYEGRGDLYYDEGGNEFREMMRGPPPAFDRKERQYTFTEKDMDDETWDFVMGLLLAEPEQQSTRTLSRAQLFYVGNTSPKNLGMYLANVYRALIRTDNAQIIPMDNLTFYERTHGTTSSENQGAVRPRVRRAGKPLRRT